MADERGPANTLGDEALPGILDAIGTAIWVYDGETITYVNHHAVELTQYPREDLVGSRFFESLIEPDDRELIIERGRARIRGEPVPESYEIRIRRRDGVLRHLSLHARRTTIAGKAVSVVSATDVTDLREAQRTIQDGAAQVIRFLNGVPASIIATDAAGKPTFVNQHWLELTGMPRDDAMKYGTSRLIHPGDVEQARTRWDHAKATGEGYDIEYRVRDAHGEFRWQFFRIRPLKNAEGELTGWTSAAIDVHDAKELREQLQETIEELGVAVRSKDELIGLISHELRTPLTTLLLNAAYLNKNPGLDEASRQEFTSELVNDAQRLNTVIENMLVLSRVSAGDIETEPTRLNGLVQETANEFRRRAPGRVLDVSCPGESAMVEVNPVYFKQVLGNLLSNAHKYSPGDRPIRLAIAGGESHAIIRVVDEGPGIPGEEVEQVFTPFFRSKTQSNVGGIGLGLTVCRRLVELQGGQIDVENVPGGGCAFWFTVPLTNLDGA